MKRRIMVVLALLIGMLGTAHAQDGGLTGDQRAALDVVNEAITTTLAQANYHVSRQNSTTQTTQSADNPSVNFSIEDSSSVDVRFDAGQQLTSAQGQLTVQITPSISGIQTPVAPVIFEARFVLADEYLYERFDPAGELALLLNLPDQWLVLSYDDLNAILANEYSMSALGLQLRLFNVLIPRPDGGFTLVGLPTGPLPDAFLIDIQEVAGAALDGQSMRVFELTLDPLYWAVETAKANPLTQADPTADLDAATIQALRVWLRAHINDRQTIWIGAEDHLIHRIETHSTGGYDTAALREAIPALAAAEAWSGDTMTTTFDKTDTVTFSAFGVPVEIIAPEDALPFVGQFERNP